MLGSYLILAQIINSYNVSSLKFVCVLPWSNNYDLNTMSGQGDQVVMAGGLSRWIAGEGPFQLFCLPLQLATPSLLGKMRLVLVEWMYQPNRDILIILFIVDTPLQTLFSHCSLPRREQYSHNRISRPVGWEKFLQTTFVQSYIPILDISFGCWGFLWFNIQTMVGYQEIFLI